MSHKPFIYKVELWKKEEKSIFLLLISCSVSAADPGRHQKDGSPGWPIFHSLHRVLEGKSVQKGNEHVCISHIPIITSCCGEILFQPFSKDYILSWEWEKVCLIIYLLHLVLGGNSGNHFDNFGVIFLDFSVGCINSIYACISRPKGAKDNRHEGLPAWSRAPERLQTNIQMNLVCGNKQEISIL